MKVPPQANPNKHQTHDTGADAPSGGDDHNDNDDFDAFLLEIQQVTKEESDAPLHPPAHLLQDASPRDHHQTAPPSELQHDSFLPSQVLQRPASPPTSPLHPHFFSEKHAKFLKRTEYGTMEFLPAVNQWIPWFGILDDAHGDETSVDEESILKKYQDASYGKPADHEERVVHQEAPSKKRKREDSALLANPFTKRQRRDIPTIRIDGIPESVTKERLAEAFTKCGLLLKDEHRQPKIHFMEENSDSITCHGDTSTRPMGRSALLTFLQAASVELAQTLMDGTSLPGTNEQISVRRATQEEIKIIRATHLDKDTKKMLRKEKKRQLRQLHWTVHDDVSVGLPSDSGDQPQFKVVILRNVFTQQDLITNPNLKVELQKSIWSTCGRICQSAAILVSSQAKTVNPVKKVKAYMQHADGVVAVHFRKASDAAKAAYRLDGKLYRIENASVPTPSRIVKAEIWKKRVSEINDEFGGNAEGDADEDLKRLHAFVGEDDDNNGRQDEGDDQGDNEE